VEKNGKEATKWYRKAADQGNESAKDILKRIPEHVISEQMLISEQLPKEKGYTHLAWNLAYNFSSEEKVPNERWKWVNAGISLLRDEAIPQHPDEPELYHELAWIFQHKMGQDMDVAQRKYKNIWINQMTDVLWPSLEDCMKNGGRPNFKELINPPKDDSRKSMAIRARVRRLTNEFKMDPRKMQQIDRELGTAKVPDENGKMQPKYVGLEWRLPEIHSIYWSWVGHKKCQDNIPRKDLVRKLRRLMFQSLFINYKRGRLVVDRYVPDWQERYRDGRAWILYPRLESIGVVENIFQKQLEWIETVLANQKQKSKELTKKIKELELELDELAERPKDVTDATLDTFQNGHHSFYRKAVTDLYMNNRMDESHYYFKLLCQGYPEKMKFYIGYDVKTKTMDLDTFATERIVQDMKSGGRQQTMAILNNLIARAYGMLSFDEDEQAKGHMRLAQRAHERYNRRKAGNEEDRVLLPPFDHIHNKGLNSALKFFGQKHPLKAANLRQRLGLKDGEEAKHNALPDAINPFKKNNPDKK
ncbi:MAG: hypothetical protein QF685_10080, partial [Verrucomicrobiota bacterium]|nr:hypothetical protein [Verrucomicrobiota bacterium]